MNNFEIMIVRGWEKEGFKRHPELKELQWQSCFYSRFEMILGKDITESCVDTMNCI